MSYKIVKSPRAWWPVTFAGVSEEGEVVKNGFEMRFKLLDEDEQVEVELEFRKVAEREGADQLKPSALMAEAVMRIAEDWRDVTMDDGSETGASMPFTPDNVAELMKVPNVFWACAAAYRACRAGEPDARLGN